MKRILFICHSACRTGAPLVLLGLLKWLKGNTDYLLSVLIVQDGPLTESFRLVADVALLSELMEGVPRPVWQRVLRKAGLTFQQDYLYGGGPQKYPKQSIDLIYSNTIVNGEALHRLRYLDVPVLVHVHELEWWIEHYGKSNMSFNLNYATRFVGVSQSVCEVLTKKYGVALNRISLIHEPLLHDACAGSLSIKTRHDLFNHYGVPAGGFIVGGCGAEGWRKGKDLFLQVAYHFKKKYADIPVSFVWVGGTKSGDEYRQLEYDIKHSGLESSVRFIPHVDNAQEIIQHFDVFCMTSREDPFPLVNLEAAAFGIPIVCFDESGGPPEFVGKDLGFVVPYMDTLEMAGKVAHILRNPDLRQSIHAAAHKRVESFHPDIIYNKLLSVIHELLKA